MTEIELVEGLKNGENLAFQYLVENYRRKVISTCFGFTNDIAAALDLSQEVFIEVYRSVEKFRGEAKISTWVFRIATNKSLNWVRDNKKRSYFKSIERFFVSDKTQIMDLEDKNSRNVIKVMENSEDSISIQKAIDKLPENQRIAFVLNKIDELNYKQVCEVMDMSMASVESLIHRARLNLQKYLKDLERD